MPLAQQFSLYIHASTHYVCNSKRKGKCNCDCRAVKKQELEDLVINITARLLKSNNDITNLAKSIIQMHEQMIIDDSPLRILETQRNEAYKSVDNIIKAIEKGLLNEFTKDRLASLQAEINDLDIEINKEKQRTYASLTVDEVEKYLLSKVFSDSADIRTRKFIVKTFIQKIIWYGDKIHIIYNFHDNADNIKITVSNVEELEKQIEKGSQPAFSLCECSYILQSSTPKTLRFEVSFFFSVTRGGILRLRSVAFAVIYY